jgi:hypothetical protein
VRINEEPFQKVEAGSAHHEIQRRWRKGDRVVLEFPIQTRLVRGKESRDGFTALLRGPLVYSIHRERSGNLPDNSLRNVRVDVKSLRAPIEETAVRPGGTTLLAEGWSPERDPNLAPDLRLVFTEFLDPAGEEVYFRTPEGTGTVEDELYGKVN